MLEAVHTEEIKRVLHTEPGAPLTDQVGLTFPGYRAYAEYHPGVQGKGVGVWGREYNDRL